MTESPPRKKLLFVVTEDWYFHSHRLAHAVAAAAAGYEVSVATRVAAHGELIRSAGVQLIPFEMSRRGFNPFSELRTLLRLVRLYREYRPDIVHHVALKPVVYGSIAARRAWVPAMINAISGLGYAFTSADRKARMLKRVLGFVLPWLINRSGSRVIVQNPDDQAALLRMRVDPDRVKLILGAGVDPSAFAVRAPPDGPALVVLASRMIWAKGIRAFVDAAAKLKPRFPSTRFVLVGKPDPGNPKAVPESQLVQWNASGPVEWWGFREDMADVLGQCHLVCFPSTYGEGIPKVLIEAAAIGRPIVATDIAGCREVVKDGENGLLVTPGDDDALVAALTRLIEDAVLRKAMGSEGRARFERLFAIQGVVRATLQAYEEALSE